MTGKRLANFELLRILAMLMVVTMHYLAGRGWLPGLNDGLIPGRAAVMALESLCIVAVNVYVLLSGYFMIGTEFKAARIIRLVFQVLFYALLIPLLLAAAGVPVQAQQNGIYGILPYVLPVSAGHYWFATEYVCLYLFSPFLNLACTRMTRRQMGGIIGLLLLLFCVIKSIVPVSLATDRFGYDFGWFMCLYIVGGYIRLHGIGFLEKKKRGWWLYLGSAAGILAAVMGSYFLYRSTGLFAYYFEVPFHYNYILSFLGAVGLFYGFSQIRVKEGKAAQWIRAVAPLCFGVYLLHAHMDVKGRWIGWTQVLFGGWAGWGTAGLIVIAAAEILFIFCLGIGVDFLRCRLFALVEKKLFQRLI